MAVETVTVMMAAHEWSSTTSMEGIAKEQISLLPEEKRKWGVVVVHEHGGWWLAYAAIDGEVRCVGSANDAAVFPEDVKRWWQYRDTLARDVGEVYRTVNRNKKEAVVGG